MTNGIIILAAKCHGIIFSWLPRYTSSSHKSPKRRIGTSFTYVFNRYLLFLLDISLLTLIPLRGSLLWISGDKFFHSGKRYNSFPTWVQPYSHKFSLFLDNQIRADTDLPWELSHVLSTAFISNSSWVIYNMRQTESPQRVQLSFHSVHHSEVHLPFIKRPLNYVVRCNIKSPSVKKGADN